MCGTQPHALSKISHGIIVMESVQFWQRWRRRGDKLSRRSNDLDMYWIDLLLIMRRQWHVARGRGEQPQQFQNMQHAMRRCSVGAITKFSKRLQLRCQTRLNCERIQVEPKRSQTNSHQYPCMLTQDRRTCTTGQPKR